MPGMGNPPTQAQSRLIPGAPMISTLPGGASGGMTSNLPAGSLLGRDVPPPPVTPATQALMSNAAFPGPAFGAGGGMPTLPQAPAVPASPLPAGRNLAALRPNRGTNVIRLAMAAVFLLGFLGLAAFFLKDTISGYLGSTPDAPETTEPATKIADTRSGLTPNDAQPPATLGKTTAATTPPDSKPVATTETPPAKPPPAAAESTQPLMGTVSDLEAAPIPKAEPATPSEVAMVKSAEPFSPPPASTPDSPVPSPGGEPVPVASTPPKIPEAAPGAPTPRDAVAGGLDDKPSEKIPAEAEPALKTLKAFLAASSAEERAAHVLGADLMKPLLDRYYSRNNDGPITIDHISFGRYDKQPELGAGAHCIFHIESKTWEYPVPAMLEEQPDGWKVDWLTFIELKDRKLEEFFKTYQEGKAAFHVGIFRQHYFGDEVPNRDQKDAFSIGLPRPNPFRSPVFLSKDAELARQLRERLPWEVHVWAIVELEWKKLGSQQWVELVSMPQMHWYSVPAAPRPISTSEKPPAEAPAGGELLPPGIKRSPAGSAPTIQRATPVPDQAFPPGIKRSPATRGR